MVLCPHLNEGLELKLSKQTLRVLALHAELKIAERNARIKY